MLANIARIVEQFKQSWVRELEDEAILQAVAETGHRWRDRKLSPLVTIRLFLLQILHGNTACNHVPHLAAMNVTGSAYCAARARLPLAAIQTLLSRATTKMSQCVRDSGRWRGHRLFLVDGSSFSMPDTPALRATSANPANKPPVAASPRHTGWRWSTSAAACFRKS